MKNTCNWFSMLCLIIGLAAGSVAGHYQGVAVTLQASHDADLRLYGSIANDIETRGEKHGKH